MAAITASFVILMVTMTCHIIVTEGILVEQKVYIQQYTITDYLYKYDLPAMDNFTYCFWLNMAHGLGHCFPASVASSSHDNQHFYAWEYIQTDSRRRRVFGGSTYHDEALSDELMKDIETGWHKHCVVNKNGEYIKGFMDRETPGVLEEMDSGDSLGAIPSGSALLLLQEQDELKGGLNLAQVCISKMAMFNMWDTSLTLEELNALECQDQGNIINMDNLDIMGKEPEYITEMFPCPEVKASTLPKRDNSMMFCRKEGTTLPGNSYVNKPSTTVIECAKLCSFDFHCQSANFQSSEKTCELNGVNENEPNIALESTNASVHLSSVNCH